MSGLNMGGDFIKEADLQTLANSFYGGSGNGKIEGGAAELTSITFDNAGTAAQADATIVAAIAQGDIQPETANTDVKSDYTNTSGGFNFG